MKISLLTIAILFCSLFGTHSLKAQSELKPVILTGFLKDAQTDKELAYANVMIPEAGVGTPADFEGKFQLRVFAGDSLVITSIGYRTSYYIVPADKKESYTVIIPISEEITMLPAVEVFPYSTEQSFKEAFLAMDNSDPRTEELKKNLEARKVAKMGFELGMDGDLNYRNTMDAQSNTIHNQTFIPTLQLLNPFAWAKFIKSVKDGDYKKGKYKDYMKE